MEVKNPVIVFRLQVPGKLAKGKEAASFGKGSQSADPGEGAEKAGISFPAKEIHGLTLTGERLQGGESEKQISQSSESNHQVSQDGLALDCGF